jgi:hypothetical protein
MERETAWLREAAEESLSRNESVPEFVGAKEREYVLSVEQRWALVRVSCGFGQVLSSWQRDSCSKKLG